MKSVRHELVVVGASWGGLDALGRLLASLPADLDAAVAIAQHRGPSPETSLAALLQARSTLPLREVEDKDSILRGRVHLAPYDYHLLVEPGSFALSTDPPVQFSRPSIDVLFESAADVYGERAVGVVLTGANADGAAGLRRIKECGGFTVVQEPGTADSRILPDAAIAAAQPDRVVPVEEIAPLLVELCGRQPVEAAP